MHDVEGYSLEELETMLETPLGTLKSRLHRARQRLLLPMEPFSADERVKGLENRSIGMPRNGKVVCADFNVT
jgi:hypothetical protein